MESDTAACDPSLINVTRTILPGSDCEPAVVCIIMPTNVKYRPTPCAIYKRGTVFRQYLASTVVNRSSEIFYRATRMKFALEIHLVISSEPWAAIIGGTRPPNILVGPQNAYLIIIFVY